MIPAPAAAAALLLFATLPAAAQSTHVTLVDEKTSTVVEVTGVFSYAPPTGYAPVRVKAVNNTSGDLAVTMNTTGEGPNSYGGDHELESRFSFTAPAGKTTEREFLVPLCTNFHASGYSAPSLRMDIQAGGRTERFSTPCGGFGNMPFVAFSKALAGKTIADINGAVSSSSGSYRYSNENFACLFDASTLSSDWRAYSGVDVLAVTSDEWSVLQSGVKSAVLQWVKLGGALCLYSKSGKLDFGAMDISVQGRAGPGPGYGGDDYQLGNGRVCDIRWSGAPLDARAAADFEIDAKASGGTRSPVRRKEYSDTLSTYESNGRNRPGTPTPLVARLGEKSFAAWQVGVILFIFGIVVGPVNLFYFAGRERRHRLFFTTPLISLAAAALLLVVIFFQDGTGGRGHRASLVYLDSAENSAFIHQVQVSRTGVLFGAAFTLEDAAAVNMGIMPDSRWTRLKSHTDPYGYRGSRSETQRYSVQDRNWGGDWFQSRSEQAHFIDAVQSTRGRIELRAGSNPPVITSTFGAPLERVCYVDAAGKHWASSGTVSTGAEVTLAEITPLDFANWRNEAAAVLPGAIRDRIGSHDARQFFYASSTDPKAGIVDTLDSIDWESSTVFLYGPLK